MAKNPKWYLFEDMTAKCYKALDNGNIIKENWYSAFDTLLEIIGEEQSVHPGSFGELLDIDRATEFKYNVQGWVDDYFRELQTFQDFDRIYRDGMRLMDTFRWQEQSPAQIRLRVVNAMERLGMHDAAMRYSEEWNGSDPDDMNAILAAMIAGKRVEDLK